MPSRPVWQGHLRLSLVTCPVAVHKATTEARDVRFHLLNPDTHNRVKQTWKGAATGDEGERRDLVRGFEVARDEYILVSDDEVKALKLESTKVLDIERFVDASTIDRLYWDQPYLLVPDGKAAMQPFGVIREAMAGEGKVALGRLVMANRERIAAVETRKAGMLLTTLRSHQEVREDADLFEAIPEVKIDARMIEIARQILAQSQGAFDPAEFRDRYEEALRAVVETKAAGTAPAKSRPAFPSDSNVIDLMEALRRSLNPAAPASGNRSKARPPKAAARAKAVGEEAPPAGGENGPRATQRRQARRRRGGWRRTPPGGRMNRVPALRWTGRKAPPLQALDGAAIVRHAAAAKGHDVVGAESLEAGAAREAWHTFADLMRDVADGAADLDEADRAALADLVDLAIKDLAEAGARVIAGEVDGVLHVAILHARREGRSGR